MLAITAFVLNWLHEPTIDIFSSEIRLFLLWAEGKLEREIVSVDFKPELPKSSLQPWVGQRVVVLLRLEAKILQQTENKIVFKLLCKNKLKPCDFHLIFEKIYLL